MPTALTLSGSIRTGSLNQKLQMAMGERLAAAGVAVNAITLKDFEMPLFNQDLEPDDVPEAAGRLVELFRTHDIIFIACPEYNGGVPPLMVNTIAWLSRQKPSPFRHAIFGTGGVSPGKYSTIWAQSHLRDSLSKIGALVVPTLLGIGPAETAIGPDGKILDAGVDKKMEQMVKEFTNFSRGGI